MFNEANSCGKLLIIYTADDQLIRSILKIVVKNFIKPGVQYSLN
jgi:hypothetical protein